MLSGEIYYQSVVTELTVKHSSEKISEFLSFLVSNPKTGQHTSIDKGSDLGQLQQVRRSLLRAYRKQQTHISSIMSDEINGKIRKLLNSIMLKQGMVKIMTENSHAKVDKALMDAVLNYFDILKREISYNRYNVDGDFSDIIAKRKQVELVRNIRKFGLCLELETSSLIQLQVLPQNSSQSKRCMKAVIDNINTSLLDQQGLVGVDVTAVFKLDHQLLSKGLQQSAGSASAGKIKGLFCMLSPENVYKFCTYGCSGQQLFSQQSPFFADQLDPTTLPNVFRTPWFCCGTPAAVSVGSGASVSNRAAVRAAALLKQMYGSARQLSLAGPPMQLRFSRLATSSQIAGSQLGSSSSLYETIVEALHEGCDAIYSEAVDEYVLLNGTFVLPEFLMHLQFKKSEAGQHSLAERIQRSVVKAPSACLHTALAYEREVGDWLLHQEERRGSEVDDESGLPSALSSHPGCAATFSANMCHSVGSSVASATATATNRVGVGVGADIDALAQAFASFDSRLALMQKQDLVRSVDKSVEDFMGMRSGIIQAVFGPHADEAVRG